MKYLIKCIVCGKEKMSQRKTQKYCSRTCMGIGQKGRKMPHSKEWEEKRIKAVRENSWKNLGRKSPKSKETIKIALAELKQKMIDNPEKYKRISIKNLPKTERGEKNFNWRGGITKKNYSWRLANYEQYKKWRNKILEKYNNKCAECGSVDKLEAHHIIPLYETKKFAFELWNGVCLCRNCHKKTNSFGGRKKSKVKTIINIQKIPHKWQEYDTAGNWKITKDGRIFILVSDLKNVNYEFLVGIHELVETILCKYRKIKESDVSKFDTKTVFEVDPKNADDPGVSKFANYHNEHMFATKIEKMLAKELGVDWKEYDRQFNDLKY